MFLGRSFTLATILLYGGVVWTVNGLTLKDVFVVHTAPDPGGCSADQQTILERWFDESYDLVSAALDTADKYTEDTEVRKAVSTFFGVKPPNNNQYPPEIDNLEDKINGVFNLLNGEVTNKPHLFCDSTYLEPKGANDPVQDNQGQLIPKEGQPGKYAKIKDYYKNELAGGRKPFWIDSLKVYEFEPTELGAKYCSDSANMGVTAEVMLEYENLDSITQIVTICPQAFTTQKYKDQLVQGSDVVVGEKMKDFQPKSLTLLHECFHVVWNVEMLSGKNEKYGPELCAEFALEDPAAAVGADDAQGPQANPDSYVYFAMAMYYLDKSDLDLSTLTAQAADPNNEEGP